MAQWIENFDDSTCKVLACTTQGHVLLWEKGDRPLVVKAATGRGLYRWVCGLMHCYEFGIYRRLGDLDGVPGCLGLVDRRHLVLEFVEGEGFRGAEIPDREAFFGKLFEIIEGMHERGVAHGDLKRKENLLVIDGARPCLVDFGTGVVRKSGFAPFRNFLFRTLRQFDRNAWVKLKYGKKLEGVSDEDSAVYQRTFMEKIAFYVKKGYPILLWLRAKFPRLYPLDRTHK